MRLENILALTHGELVSSPFVNKFENIVFEAKQVKRGDLFVAYDEMSIEEAVFNGAYGIVFCKPTQIIDSEIAWIKVKNLDDALRRILRFILIDKEITVYSCSKIVLKLALQVITEPSFIALHGDTRCVFNALKDVESHATVLFSPALTSSDIFTSVKTIPRNENEKIDIIEQTLFETSFIYDNVFYERQPISPFFMPYLEELLHLFKILKINFRLRKFTPIDHFEAVFTNKKFEIKEFGTSDTVLIFEKEIDLIEKEILFLQKEATWAQTLFVIPQSAFNSLSESLREHPNLLVYKNKNGITNLLREHKFHFALVVGVDKSILTQPLTKQTQLSLFDFS
jgi:ferrochelatase